MVTSMHRLLPVDEPTKWNTSHWSFTKLEDNSCDFAVDRKSSIKCLTASIDSCWCYCWLNSGSCCCFHWRSSNQVCHQIFSVIFAVDFANLKSSFLSLLLLWSSSYSCLMKLLFLVFILMEKSWDDIKYKYVQKLLRSTYMHIIQ